MSLTRPDKDGRDVECGLVGDRESVGPQGQAAPLLESGDASLDGIALLVFLGLEAGRSASGTASPQAVTDLVCGLRDDSPDTSATKVSTDRAYSSRAGPRGPRAAR
jgi:hypothetical protein